MMIRLALCIGPALETYVASGRLPGPDHRGRYSQARGGRQTPARRSGFEVHPRPRRAKPEDHLLVGVGFDLGLEVAAHGLAYHDAS